MANARKWNVMTLPVLAILYLSAIKYKNDLGSLADLVVKFAIKGLFFVLVSVLEIELYRIEM